MFPNISARRYKKLAVLNCTAFAYGSQGLSGKDRGGGNVSGGSGTPLASHGKPWVTVSLKLM
jgi:hypothetical protein